MMRIPFLGRAEAKGGAFAIVPPQDSLHVFLMWREDLAVLKPLIRVGGSDCRLHGGILGENAREFTIAGAGDGLREGLAALRAMAWAYGLTVVAAGAIERHGINREVVFELAPNRAGFNLDGWFTANR